MANRIGFKLDMIIGENNGPPFDRTINRLARMIPKAQEAGEEIPETVLAFINEHELGEAIEAEMRGEIVDQSEERVSDDG
jgi:hypothetical protein